MYVLYRRHKGYVWLGKPLATKYICGSSLEEESFILVCVWFRKRMLFTFCCVLDGLILALGDAYIVLVGQGRC